MPPLTRGVMLAPTASTEIGDSSIFSYISAPTLTLPLEPPIKPPPASYHTKTGAGGTLVEALTDESLESPMYASYRPGAIRF
jgi:hypothetical protein